MSEANEFEALAAAKAATNGNLLTLKSALRERFDPATAALVSRCLDNAYSQGFCEGAIHALNLAKAAV